MGRKAMRYENEAVELQCFCCKDYWPATTEFYFRNGKYKDGQTRLHSWCKDCYVNNPKFIAKRKRWADLVKSRNILQETIQEENYAIG